MPVTGVWDNIAALAVVPVAVWVIATGLGLLGERATRTRLPNELLAPLGFAIAVVVCLAVYTTGAGNGAALPVLIALVLAGYALARHELPGRLNAGWPLLAALAVYLLFDASVIATGHWTFVGYHLQDDTAFEMLLARHLQGYGTQLGTLPPSTASSYIQAFLSTGYPLGGQSFLAALSGILHADVGVIYQGYLSSLAAIGALAASTICGKVFGRRISALVGLLAISASMSYQYAQQGAIKEVSTTVAVLCALALIRFAILELRSYAAAAIAAIPLAAVLCTYNAAGVPYVAAMAGTGLAAAVFVHMRLPSRAWIRPAGLGLAVFGVLAAAPLSTVATFFNAAANGFTAINGSAGNSLPLGQLLRPLPLSEVNGIWLVRDYRIMVPPGSLAELEVVATIVMLVLLAIGTIYALVRREPGILIGVATMGAVLAIVYPQAIPYAQAKLLAIASPIVVLGAAYGLAALASWRRLVPLAALLGAALTAGILGSDALAYHGNPVAPSSQMVALAQVGRAIGPRGPVLVSEFQEFAKYFGAPAQMDVGTEYPSPENLVNRLPGGLYGQSFDLDQEQLAFVEGFPYILVRRSPTASRPPANYRLIYENYYYQVYKRTPGPRVLAHMPLQTQFSGVGAVPCPALRAMVAQAPKSSRLAVSYLPPLYGYAVVDATVRSKGWFPNLNPFFPSMVSFATPGVAGKVISVPRSGDYRVWIEGSSPRPLRITLDDHRTISEISGINTNDEWLEGSTVHVGAGRHPFDVFRPGGGLAPGDGGSGEVDQGKGWISYMALVAAKPVARMVTLPVSRWHTLCGREADWVELISATK